MNIPHQHTHKLSEAVELAAAILSNPFSDSTIAQQAECSHYHSEQNKAPLDAKPAPRSRAYSVDSCERYRCSVSGSYWAGMLCSPSYHVLALVRWRFLLHQDSRPRINQVCHSTGGILSHLSITKEM